jgi:hypothetical protein
LSLKLGVSDNHNHTFFDRNGKPRQRHKIPAGKYFGAKTALNKQWLQESFNRSYKHEKHNLVSDYYVKNNKGSNRKVK